jgi:hypothetical protein
MVSNAVRVAGEGCYTAAVGRHRSQALDFAGAVQRRGGDGLEREERRRYFLLSVIVGSIVRTKSLK